MKLALVEPIGAVVDLLADSAQVVDVPGALTELSDFLTGREPVKKDVLVVTCGEDETVRALLESLNDCYGVNTGLVGLNRPEVLHILRNFQAFLFCVAVPALAAPLDTLNVPALDATGLVSSEHPRAVEIHSYLSQGVSLLVNVVVLPVFSCHLTEPVVVRL